MSLKAFHVLFIIMAILLAAGCAAWAYVLQVEPGFGAASAAVALSLAIYGVWFLRKSRKIIV